MFNSLFKIVIMDLHCLWTICYSTQSIIKLGECLTVVTTTSVIVNYHHLLLLNINTHGGVKVPLTAKEPAS